MLTDKLMKGSNGQSARKFLTFGIESTSYKAARAKLMSIKNDIIKGFKAFGVEAELLDGKQRLEALYYALNPYRNSPSFSIGTLCLKLEWTRRTLSVLHH